MRGLRANNLRGQSLGFSEVKERRCTAALLQQPACSLMLVGAGGALALALPFARWHALWGV